MNIDWTPKKVGALACVLIVGVLVGLWLRSQLVASSRKAGAQAGTRTVNQQPAATPGQYSLTIPAQRARDYPRSSITQEGPMQTKDELKQGVISYRSDGLKIFAATYQPNTAAPTGGFPVMILVHGYVQPSDYQTDEAFYTDFATAYARKGFLVVKPDLRGHGHSWGVPEGAYFSSGYVADVLNLAASVSGIADANGSSVSLLGHSMGGHVALEAALVRPQAFKGVVIAAGSVGTLEDMYYNWTAYSDFGDPVTLGIRRRVLALFGEPKAGNDFWHDADPYSYLSDPLPPLLLAHATNDDTVPYRFSTELHDALQAAGHQAKLSTYGGGHSFNDDARQPFLDESASFLMQQLVHK